LLLPSKSSAASFIAGDADHTGPLKPVWIICEKNVGVLFNCWYWYGQVHTYVHDSQEVTLEPVWNDCTYFSLPMLPSVGPGASPPPSSMGVASVVSGDVLLSEYWSRGTLKVEVMDGDRFNEDTHLGEVCVARNQCISSDY
jgi:hypothetical protein